MGSVIIKIKIKAALSGAVKGNFLTRPSEREREKCEMEKIFNGAKVWAYRRPTTHKFHLLFSSV